jgi:hypothetical protein
LTTASYWRPSGKNIHRFPDSKETDDWGVKPNDSGYKLTAPSLDALKSDGVPEAVLGKLKTFPDKRFGTETEYLDELARLLSPAEMSQFKPKLLADADRGFEVPMKDEELRDYLIYRNNRDVVRAKNTKPVENEKKDAKDKKPFVDRVLEKALEHLRKEIDRIPALPETKNG